MVPVLEYLAERGDPHASLPSGNASSEKTQAGAFLICLWCYDLKMTIYYKGMGLSLHLVHQVTPAGCLDRRLSIVREIYTMKKLFRTLFLLLGIVSFALTITLAYTCLR